MEEVMLVDCDRCALRDIACAECVITVLLDGQAGLGREELRALRVLADAGLVPPLRFSTSQAASPHAPAPAASPHAPAPAASPLSTAPAPPVSPRPSPPRQRPPHQVRPTVRPTARRVRRTPERVTTLATRAKWSPSGSA
jgi:hypothetical protein